MIYTSYFDNINKIRKEHPNMSFFSIAGNTPTWFYDIKKCFSYKILAPKYEWWIEWKNQFENNLESQESISFYSKNYNTTVLENLSVSTIIKELMRIGGEEICFICYETPEKFCHRKLVSKWLNKNNVKCIEYEFRVP